MLTPSVLGQVHMNLVYSANRFGQVLELLDNTLEAKAEVSFH